ncbi:MAG: RdgB/HAM1 family non-canonical purine NTP pyrophosphatase [Bacteroidota bacterium]|nr:RdgB/HAM1 family non-canonical purine NTP pyrophosphatase [Bacteroidota bacterium]MDP4233494.1 RdgB/HAM1 family non-canonical purine NTP pyrophosphatase [Bacteroidota bacterium]MDP4243371.1 RdgB/HAM1 family non-canonical purine NTP pyrophosphatase [Bacteroidota bacterium]MDP4287942.1 RdgB/HAM1 family non-canonical purine NTP pyrophosphatase [Bacteroidota bacterium]
MILILATHNPHKRDELREILRSELGDVEILTLEDIPVGEIEETGTTLEENALLKAREVYAACFQPTVADDTGLEVEALGGAPGVYSARYAGENATYADNVNKLLAELPPGNGAAMRHAKFATVVAYIDKRGEEHLFRGEVEGIITEAPRGAVGFGYDPIFQPIEDMQGRTFAEMSAEEKHAISHRGRALRLLGEYLRNPTSAG